MNERQAPFDKLRANGLLVYIPLSAPVSGTGQALRERGYVDQSLDRPEPVEGRGHQTTQRFTYSPCTHSIYTSCVALTAHTTPDTQRALRPGLLPTNKEP